MKLFNPVSIVLLSCSLVVGKVLKTKVAVLGGGISGVIAARTLSQAHIQDFLLIEAKNQLGGRLTSTEFGGRCVELGASWIQGTTNEVTGDSNPIYQLAIKYISFTFKLM
jgi:polyamine oxidase